MTDESDAPEKFQIDWIRAIAGAMAAVASAVLLSTLGAAGTIIGAALGSLVVTIASAMIAEGLSANRRKGAKRKEGAAERVGTAQAEALRATMADDTAAPERPLDHAEQRLAEAHEERDAASVVAPVGWRGRFSRLPWMRIGLTALALFVVALMLITAFELVTGRSVSSITGGSDDTGDTTIEQVGGKDSGKDDRVRDEQPTESPRPSQRTDPSTLPTESPTPSVSQEPSPAESTAVPTESQTPTPAATTSP